MKTTKKDTHFLESETLRYLVFGVLAVVFNIVSFKLLNLLVDSLVANTLAFFLSVLFTYWTNSTFVFRMPYSWKSFIQFFGARFGTLFLDDGLLWLFLKLDVNDLLAKCINNALIIVINYLVSKLVVFRKK